MSFSRRSSAADEINPIAAATLRARARGGLLDLTVSNPTLAELPYSRELLAELADPRGLRYAPEPLGIASARAAVARSYAERGHPVDPEQVVLTASTSEAYSWLFKLLCDPGDELLSPRPSYPLFEHLATLDAVALRNYRLAYDGAWHVDLDSVRSAIGPRTRALLAVSPNNPTGSFLSRAELSALGETGLPLVSDEVFSAYPLSDDPRRARSALESSAGLTFVLGGLSKLVGLPQLKLAWLVVAGAPERVRSALARLELIADTYLSVATPVQLALPRLLEQGAATRDAIRERTRRNLAVLVRAMDGTPAGVLHVEGGWSATLRLPATRSEDDWLLAILDAARVLTQPGWFFDFEGGPHLVVSLLTPEPVFDEGVARLGQRVARLA